jgi:hypothetical protein
MVRDRGVVSNDGETKRSGAELKRDAKQDNFLRRTLGKFSE